jgi:hypothetical protein
MQLIKLSDVAADDDLQPRVKIDAEVVDEYASSMRHGESFPPIIVFRDGEKNWLADGYHRYYAAKKAGLDCLAAEFRTGTKTDALKFALSANSTHGLKRSQADKKRAVLVAISEFGDLSNREIAKLVNVDDKTIGKYREKMVIADEVIQRINNGESFYAKHGDDRLFLFRLPDDPNRQGSHYIKQFFFGPGFTIFDKRGINTKYIKKFFKCLTDEAQLEMVDFEDWKSISSACLPYILEIATGAEDVAVS